MRRTTAVRGKVCSSMYSGSSTRPSIKSTLIVDNVLFAYNLQVRGQEGVRVCIFYKAGSVVASKKIKMTTLACACTQNAGDLPKAKC